MNAVHERTCASGEGALSDVKRSELQKNISCRCASSDRGWPPGLPLRNARSKHAHVVRASGVVLAAATLRRCSGSRS